MYVCLVYTDVVGPLKPCQHGEILSHFILNTVRIFIYSFNELADTCGPANGNGQKARLLYHEAFPSRQFPSHQIFTVFIFIYRRLNIAACYCQLGRETPDLDKCILDSVEENLGVSTRRIVAGAAHMTIWRVLHEQVLYPYNLQRVQCLLSADFPARDAFYRWSVQQCADLSLVSSVPFADEAGFNRDGIINVDNNQLWADEFLLGAVQSTHQQQLASVSGRVLLMII